MKTTPTRAELAAPSVPQPRRRLALKATAALGWSALAAALPACGGGGPAAAPLSATDLRRHGLGGVDSGGTGAQRSFFGVALRSVQPLSGGGVVFETASCVFLRPDDRPFDPATLAQGMTVRIDAGDVRTVDAQPRADAVTLRRAEQLVGAVQSVNGGTATLVVWSQTVQVNTDTWFDDRLAATWSQLLPGTRVRIWGQLDAARRRIVATRIDSPDSDDVDGVRGVLSALDPGQGHVELGALRAQMVDGQALPDGLVIGGVVRLTLGAPAAPGAAAELRSIAADDLLLPDRDTVELEGRVTAVGSPTSFALDGVPIDGSGATWKATAPLQPGQRVAVAGRTEQGVLIARTVEVQREDEDTVVEIEGQIRSVDSAGQRFSVGRRSIRWSETTRFEDSTPASLRPRARVGLKGRRGADGMIEAFLIHVEH